MPEVIRPITPDQADRRRGRIPDAVIKVVNKMIEEAWDGERAVLQQSKVVIEICRETCESRDKIFERRWLYLEELYRSAGWEVEYDKPSTHDSYDPTFTFRRAKECR